ncbi:MAG TPA: hypothetical protein VNO20_01115 [Solirubrobacterales bacterium]|nr:hypothetical protein [Solirubrobacterales bacterium]
MRQWIFKLWSTMTPLGRVGAGACLLLAVLALALKALGASWVNVAYAVVPLAVACVLVAMEPRLHGLTRPKPKLTLTVEGAKDGRLVNDGLPPWPFQIQRIVDNETAEALDTVRDRETLPSWLTTGVGLMSRPTPEDHQRAKEEFNSEVETYKEELREWLDGYSEATLAEWETFEVSLALTNAVGAAHGEAVEVVLELPESVSLGSADRRVDVPPARPTYRPPQPRALTPSHIGPWRGPYSTIASGGRDFDLDDLVPFRRSQQTWDLSANSRHLTAPRVEVLPGWTIEIAEALWLRARGPGVHEVQWTVYSQSLDHPIQGSFELVLPEGDPQRPPFGRMAGILRFPDTLIAPEEDADETEDEDGEPSERAVRPIRDSDPPLTPPTADVGEGSDVAAKLQAASHRWQWEALGLDPALDGPSSDRVQVGEASPRRSAG